MKAILIPSRIQNSNQFVVLLRRSFDLERIHRSVIGFPDQLGPIPLGSDPVGFVRHHLIEMHSPVSVPKHRDFIGTCRSRHLVCMLHGV